jgi:hypothetical protein
MTTDNKYTLLDYAKLLQTQYITNETDLLINQLLKELSQILKVM